MADRIHASSEWLEKCARDLNSIENAICSASSALSSINLRHDEGGKLRTTLSCSLKMTGGHFSGNNAADDIRQLQRAAAALGVATASLRSGASSAARLFADAENRATQIIQSVSGGNDAQTYNTGVTGNSGNAILMAEADVRGVRYEGLDPRNMATSLASTVKSVIGKFGVFGSTVSTAWGFISDLGSGKVNTSSLVKYANTGRKVAAKWIDLHKRYKKLSNFGKDYSNPLKWREAFGLNKYWNGSSAARRLSKAAKGLDRFKANFSKQFKDGLTSKGAWITAGITSAFNNYTQHKDALKTGAVTIDRVGVEWATEMGMTVALDSAATAVAAAGLAALGFTGAPVVAVGVAAVGVSWAADFAFKKITGSKKGIAETVGDKVGELYDNTLKPAVKEGVKKVQQGFDNVKGWATSKAKAAWCSVF